MITLCEIVRHVSNISITAQTPTSSSFVLTTSWSKILLLGHISTHSSQKPTPSPKLPIIALPRPVRIVWWSDSCGSSAQSRAQEYSARKTFNYRHLVNTFAINHSNSNTSGHARPSSRKAFALPHKTQHEARPNKDAIITNWS